MSRDASTFHIFVRFASMKDWNNNNINRNCRLWDPPMEDSAAAAAPPYAVFRSAVDEEKRR